MLFVQGTRDTFGTPLELQPILAKLSPSPTLHGIEQGDHSFKVGGRHAKNRQEAIDRDAQETVFRWVQSHAETANRTS